MLQRYSGVETIELCYLEILGVLPRAWADMFKSQCCKLTKLEKRTPKPFTVSVLPTACGPWSMVPWRLVSAYKYIKRQSLLKQDHNKLTESHVNQFYKHQMLYL